MAMNWVDYIILAIFLFSALAGFGRGFAKEMMSLLTWIAAFLVASMFANSLATMLTHSAPVQNVVQQAAGSLNDTAAQSVSYAGLGISFVILFVGTLIAGSLVSHFVNIAFQVGMLGFGNRVLGALFGLGRGFIINMVVIFVVQLTPLSSQPAWRQSQLVIAFQPAIAWLDRFVSPALANLQSRFGDTLQNINSQFQNMQNFTR